MSRAGVQSALAIASKPGKYGGIKKSSIKNMGFLTDYLTAKNRADEASKAAFVGQKRDLNQAQSRAENSLTSGLLNLQRGFKSAVEGAGSKGSAIAGAIQLGLGGMAQLNDPITQGLQKLQALAQEQRTALAANALTAQQTVDSNLKSAYDVANDKYLSDRTLQGSALTAAAGLEGQIYAADQALKSARAAAAASRSNGGGGGRVSGGGGGGGGGDVGGGGGGGTVIMGSSGGVRNLTGSNALSLDVPAYVRPFVANAYNPTTTSYPKPKKNPYYR